MDNIKQKKIDFFFSWKTKFSVFVKCIKSVNSDTMCI